MILSPMKYRHFLLAGLLTLALGLSAQTKELRLPNGVRITNHSVIPADSFVTVTMQFIFDEVRMRSNGVRAYTPVMIGRDGQEHYLRPVLLTGRRQHFVQLRQPNPHYPDAIEVRRKNGTAQKLSYVDHVRRADWMSGATVKLVEDSCGCGVLLAQHIYEHPIGMVRLSTDRAAVDRLLGSVELSCIRPQIRREEKTYTLEGRAFLDFRVNKTDIDANYRNNPIELDKIMKTIDVVRTDTNATITGISIHGYASPEGSYEHNAYLAENRALALKDYVRRLRHFDERLFIVRSTPEDWAGFDSLLSRSNLPEREAMLALVRSDMDPDKRNEEIRRRWPNTYHSLILKEWYPALRHSDYVVNYTIREFTTPEEALRVYREKPYQLSLSELHMVASIYDPGNQAYNDVLMTAARLYPDDAEANLNAAIVCLNQRDLSQAGEYLRKAGQSPAAQHARGVLAMLKGNYAEAAPLLREAAEAGVPHAAANYSALQMLSGAE